MDEGQDFEARWFELLQRLLAGPDAVFWVFHDPGQALIRTDVVAGLGLECHELFENHRNPGSIARLAARFYHGGEETIARPTAERRYTVISAEPGAATLEALRKTLHRLVEEERVAPFRIAVLSGATATASEVWRHRRFGNAPLENAALHDDGTLEGPRARGRPRRTRRGPLRDDPPLQGHGARGRGPRGAADRRRAAGRAALRGADSRDDCVVVIAPPRLADRLRGTSRGGSGQAV